MLKCKIISENLVNSNIFCNLVPYAAMVYVTLSVQNYYFTSTLLVFLFLYFSNRAQYSREENYKRKKVVQNKKAACSYINNTKNDMYN
jgi:hypothetical protein